MEPIDSEYLFAICEVCEQEIPKKQLDSHGKEHYPGNECQFDDCAEPIKNNRGYCKHVRERHPEYYDEREGDNGRLMWDRIDEFFGLDVDLEALTSLYVTWKEKPVVRYGIHT